jgi:hypothetical protein
MAVGLLTLVLVFSGSAVAIFICRQLPTRINYRLTLKVESEGILSTGSSVIETRWYPGVINMGNAWNTRVRGEAVAVDVGGHGTLFALLTGPATPARPTGEIFYPHDPESILLEAFAAEKSRTGRSRDFLNVISKFRGGVELPLTRLPMLVRFKNPSDPRSVERVDPTNLAASFGPGARILQATLAIADEPVTTNLETQLAWLQKGNEALLNSELRAGTGLTGNLIREDFIQP